VSETKDTTNASPTANAFRTEVVLNNDSIQMVEKCVNRMTRVDGSLNSAVNRHACCTKSNRDDIPKIDHSIVFLFAS